MQKPEEEMIPCFNMLQGNCNKPQGHMGKVFKVLPYSLRYVAAEIDPKT